MLDFIKLCRARSIPYIEEGHHHCHAGWVQVHCPFCAGARGGWHLGFSLEEGNFNCWRCGSLMFWEVVGALCLTTDRGRLGAIVKEYQLGITRVKRQPKPRPPSVVKPEGLGRLRGAHYRYLRKRGFDPDALVADWGLGGTGPFSDPGWQWRVVAPIRNKAGIVVAYQGRTVGDGKPRYKMTEDAKCTEPPCTFLYGIDKVPGDTVIIVEGAPSVWRLGRGTVATLGIGWHPEQMHQLRHYKRRFVLFDPEPLAQKRAMGLGEALGLFPGTTEIVTGFKTDPGEFSASRVRRVRRELGLAAW